MNDFIEIRSPEEFAELLMQLRAENDTLREQVKLLVSSLAGVAVAVEERDSLRLEVVELRGQLGVKASVLEQVEAEFSALTNSARLVVEDRDRLREKNEELQASVNRLTNMLLGPSQ